MGGTNSTLEMAQAIAGKL